MADNREPVDDIERAMVAIRRSQSRRSLARLADRDGGGGGDSLKGSAAKGSAAKGAAFDVLDAIEAAEQGGAPATVSGVAAALAVDQPRASKLVAGAVEAGLVRREADQADGRRALLVMTEAGRALTDEVRRFRRSVFAEAMAEWPEADRAEFARLLTDFVGALDRTGGRTGGRAPR
ncbi:transcriptional regulator, MarR family protein [Streptomyces bingchenggensis BCW-1]|uniref:Transcriptional regulator, MarR family protein n=1 Tax=Streptomyces bingchenggensis (strain BCW-1) TaxID=749414 RepID=D7BR49_STRBB|nr:MULTISPECIES: MarR family winged helix-turn-helix transcriptional regulator [Streptomyces]ADI11399.1 transcriptional regulator, MarR family protein [Streptomyces bingchenggensis BCW-1]